MGVNFDVPTLLILRIHLLQSSYHRCFPMVCFILENEAEDLGAKEECSPIFVNLFLKKKYNLPLNLCYFIPKLQS